MFQPFLSFYQRADLSWKIELGYVWPNTQGAILCRVSARWKTLDVSRHSGLVKKRNKNTSGICPSSLHPLRSKKLDVAFRNIYIYSCNRLESSSSATFSVKRNWSRSFRIWCEKMRRLPFRPRKKSQLFHSHSTFLYLENKNRVGHVRMTRLRNKNFSRIHCGTMLSWHCTVVVRVG